MAPKGDAQLQADGPHQLGGSPGQYVYLIVFSHPKDETVQRLGLKRPSEFDRSSFAQLGRDIFMIKKQ